MLPTLSFARWCLRCKDGAHVTKVYVLDFYAPTCARCRDAREIKTEKDDYDLIAKELAFEAKALPSDRTLAPQEFAAKRGSAWITWRKSGRRECER